MREKCLQINIARIVFGAILSLCHAQTCTHQFKYAKQTMNSCLQCSFGRVNLIRIPCSWVRRATIVDKFSLSFCFYSFRLSESIVWYRQRVTYSVCFAFALRTRRKMFTHTHKIETSDAGWREKVSAVFWRLIIEFEYHFVTTKWAYTRSSALRRSLMRCYTSNRGVKIIDKNDIC